MNTYIKVGETRYPDAVDGVQENRSWDNRTSKAITLTLTYAQASTIFHDGTAWSIIHEYEEPILDGEGNPTGETHTVTKEYDNSDFNVLGDIVVHRDGTCTINMGKLTDTENLLEQLFGGNT